MTLLQFLCGWTALSFIVGPLAGKFLKRMAARQTKPGRM